MTNSPKLSVFLCHASQDKPVVRELYQRLLAEDWIAPWLDEENLLPGQDWDLEIEKAVEASDAVIVTISSKSVTKEGYVQKELRKILDIALEKPEETIFIIPLRLDECELPRRIRSLHYVDYFPPNQQDRAYRRLLQSLHTRLVQLQPAGGAQEVPSNAAVVPKRDRTAMTPETRATVSPGPERPPVNRTGNIQLAGTLLLMIYLGIAAYESFSESSDLNETLLGISATLAGITLLLRKQFPPGLLFKIALTIYLLIYGLNYRLTNTVPVAFDIAAAAALVSGIVVMTSARIPWKHLFYSTTAFALFLFLVATYEFVTNFEYSTFTNILDTFILLTSMLASVLLWMDL